MHLEDSSRYYRCTLAVLVLSSLHYELWSHSCCNRILDNDRIRRVTVITVTYYISAILLRASELLALFSAHPCSFRSPVLLIISGDASEKDFSCRSSCS